MIPLTQSSGPVIQTAPSGSSPDGLLLMLRILMRQCRAKARMEVFTACALLQQLPAQATQAYADALLRSLAQARPDGFVIWPPQTTERSFDESWLLSLMAAIGREDHASVAFLLRRHVPHAYRRSVGWLAAQVAARLPVEIP